MNLLEHAFVGEQHPTEEAAEIGFGLILGIAAHPIDDGFGTAVEVFGVVVGEVGFGDTDAPFEGAAVSLGFLH